MKEEIVHFLKSFKLSLILLLSIVLAACAVPKHVADPDEAKVFQRVGRFSVNSVDIDGKQNAVQGGFAWLDNNQQLTLDLSNPVGSIIARIEINDNGASLQQSDGSIMHADNANDLIAQAVGSNIPVSSLRKWLRGDVGDAAIIKGYDDNKNIANLQEDGWHVDLSRYDDLGPKLLRLEHNSAGTQIKARLVIQ